MSYQPTTPVRSAPSRNASIIWCVEGEHISSLSDTHFDSAVGALCVESFLNHITPTLKILDQYKNNTDDSELPALMVSLVPKEKFAINSSVTPDKPLVVGTEIIIHRDNESSNPSNHNTFQISLLQSPPLAQWRSIHVGDQLHIGYDAILIIVLSVTDQQIKGTVITEGHIHDHMSLHLPLDSSYTAEVIESFISSSLPKLIAAQIHYILLPGCLSLHTLKTLREHISEDDVTSPWLIYRVDSEMARQQISQVMPYINGMMIARRELALTAQPDLIPVFTKEIIDQCRDYAKLTIVASQMLGSMKHNITPTRAEVSDIANAVFDGADAVMLSEDVLKGKYSQDAHQLAQKIINDITHESSSHQNKVWAQSEPDGEMDVICTQAAKTAMRAGAKALVCITKTGNTAIRLSTLDTQLPIVAITFDQQCAQKIRLLRGVQALKLADQPSIDEVLPRINERLKQTTWLQKSDKVVFVTVTLSSMSQTSSNLFTIQKIY